MKENFQSMVLVAMHQSDFETLSTIGALKYIPHNQTTIPRPILKTTRRQMLDLLKEYGSKAALNSAVYLGWITPNN